MQAIFRFPTITDIPSAQQPTQHTQAVGFALVPAPFGATYLGGKITRAAPASSPPVSCRHKNAMTVPPQKHLLETYSPKVDVVRAIILM